MNKFPSVDTFFSATFHINYETYNNNNNNNSLLTFIMNKCEC